MPKNVIVISENVQIVHTILVQRIYQNLHAQQK